MAKPRVFISSTYYDLKHIRASLGLFIDSLGYESILFEKGQIAFISDDPLDISCFREAEAADIFVLIIGGRYGSEISSEKIDGEKNQYTNYNSITRKEYDTANENHVPTYILIEKGVYAEYQTYKRNKSNPSIEYAHVDNINIFKLIDEIHNKSNNNPIFSFEKYNEIESWLREQWAGLFKDFLNRRGNIKKFDSLQQQIKHLETLNSTLKTYLETMMNDSDLSQRQAIITQENNKIHDITLNEKIKENRFFQFITDDSTINKSHQIEEFKQIISDSTGFSNLITSLKNNDIFKIKDDDVKFLLRCIRNQDSSLFQDINQIRELLDLPSWGIEENL